MSQQGNILKRSITIYIYIFVGFQRRVNMIVDPLTEPLSQEVFGNHVKAKSLRIFE